MKLLSGAKSSEIPNKLFKKFSSKIFNGKMTVKDLSNNEVMQEMRDEVERAVKKNLDIQEN